MVAKGAEVKSGTTNVPITCTISDVTSTPTVTWSDGVNSISNGADYAVGTVTLTGTMARAVLTVQKESTATTTYTCLVTSTEWLKTDDPHTVDVKVYGKYIFKLDLRNGILQKAWFHFLDWLPPVLLMHLLAHGVLE